MRTTFLGALLLIQPWGWIIAIDALGQVPSPEINKSIRVIKVGETTVQLDTKVIEKAKVTMPPSESDVVTSLVRYYRLNQSSTVNPKLVFGPNEIRYWKRRNLDRQTLRLEFAARRIILDAADQQNAPIRDQDMLSMAASAVILYLQDGSPRPGPERQKEQSVDVACLICRCEGGDTSQDLIKKAWDALNANKSGMNPKNFEKALACAKVTIAKFANDADEQQAARLQANECRKTPPPSEKDAYFASYWALSDVGAAWFIRGQVFEQQSNCKDAREAYQTIIAKYNCAYVWDPKGWFWNAAKGADQALKNLETKDCK